METDTGPCWGLPAGEEPGQEEARRPGGRRSSRTCRGSTAWPTPRFYPSEADLGVGSPERWQGRFESF